MKQLTKETIDEAYVRIKSVVSHTPLEYNEALSEKYKAKIYLKREDLQIVRSYKVRGAYNKISQLTPEEKEKGIVCASAGNHAQGVAFSCRKLHIKGTIFMPTTTPRQKIDRVRTLGKEWVTLELIGDTFDDAQQQANLCAHETGKIFVHPFDDVDVMAGQGTVALESLQQLPAMNYFVLPIGGGGLAAGAGTYLKSHNLNIKVIGVEPAGAASMQLAFAQGKVTSLSHVDKFVDGAAVQTVGAKTFEVCKNVIDKVVTVPEGRVCQEMISLYQQDGLVTEPAGALAVSSLEFLQEEIQGKTVVCVVSGGNNDVSRYSEIHERSLVYQGLKHYFLIEFSQRPGALKTFVSDILGPHNDITLFEYIKKNNREKGPALVGVEFSSKEELSLLLDRMSTSQLVYERVTTESPLYRFIL